VTLSPFVVETDSGHARVGENRRSVRTIISGPYDHHHR